MGLDNKIKFTWDKTEENTEVYYHPNGKKYQVRSFKIRGNYRIDLLEDDFAVASENTSNESFREIVDISKQIEAQILEWAEHILLKKTGKCDVCSEIKIIQNLSEYDKEKQEFKGIETICKKCRSAIYDKIWKEFRKEREQEDKLIKIELDKKPPRIIGGFKRKIDAYRAIERISNPDRVELEDGMVHVKGILKANDKSYYPAFFTIAIPGGEHWETEFIPSNKEELIPQHLVFPYIGKTEEEIFPYEYETLAHIEDDFHQKTRFGVISQRTIRHHFSNQINIERPDNWDEVEDTVKVEVRSYFSIQHLLSASFFHEQLVDFEKEIDIEPSDDELIKHRSLVVSVIMSCVSFLEASINELFMDSSENPKGITQDLSKTTIKLFAQMWRRGIPRTANYNIIEKYQIALTLAKKREFDLGILLLQNITVLIRLRNALVHFEPESVVTKSLIETTQVKRQKLEAQLIGKFLENSYTGKDNPFFPDKCLSSSCASWAINSCISFTDEFFIKMGIIPPYQRIKYKIKTEHND